jgi:acidic leucine-rich nuclear phosphoprotein 32 family protein A/C/D
LVPLTKLDKLIQLDLSECPIAEKPDYRKKVFEMFPSLNILDNKDVDGLSFDYEDGDLGDPEDGEEEFFDDGDEEAGWEEDDEEYDEDEEDDEDEGAKPVKKFKK